MSKINVTRDKKGLGHLDAPMLLRRAVKAALEAEGVAVPYQVDIMLTDDDGIRAINSEYRDIDRETDVLSFPVNELTPGAFDPKLCDTDPETCAVALGDMVISLPRCQAQGEEFGHGFKRELCYLAVHSTLHLLGYDHVDEAEGKRLMRSREEAVMELLGMGYTKEKKDGDK